MGVKQSKTAIYSIRSSNDFVDDSEPVATRKIPASMAHESTWKKK